MATHTKYGFCRVLKKWVPRDEMVSVNVTTFDDDNRKSIVRLRLSQQGHRRFMRDLRRIRWTGHLKEEHELVKDGLLVEPSVEDRF